MTAAARLCLLPAQPSARPLHTAHDTSSHFCVCSSAQIDARSIDARSIGRSTLHQNLPLVAFCRRRLLPERRALPRRAAPFMAARMAARRLPHARWQAGGGWPRLLMAEQAQHCQPASAGRISYDAGLLTQLSSFYQASIKAPSPQGFRDRAPLIELPSQ